MGGYDRRRGPRYGGPGGPEWRDWAPAHAACFGVCGQQDQTWKTRIGGGGEFTSSPWAYNGNVFCIDEEGRTFVIRAGDKFESLGTNELAEMALATPAVIGDRLILRTEKHIYCIRNGPQKK